MWRLFRSFFHFSDGTPKPSVDTKLIGDKVMLRIGDPSDWHDWRALRDTSRDFLVPWEPSWPDNALSHHFFCGLLRRHWRQWQGGTGYAFLVFDKGNFGREGKVIGGISLNDIQRGIWQKGTVGYWIGQSYAQRGLMTEAVKLVCDFGFNELQLRRIEASCLPHNEPSKKLLRRVGFEEEGYAKAYLQINGEWRDHLLWGRAAPKLRSA